MLPQVVVELVSQSSWIDDLGARKGAYELLGVQECFLIDPLGELETPQLRGFRLESDRFEPIPREPALGPLALRSRSLGLLWREDDQWGGRPVAPETGAVLLYPPEETEARQRAEAEVARLHAELDRLRSGRS